MIKTSRRPARIDVGETVRMTAAARTLPQRELDIERADAPVSVALNPLAMDPAARRRQRRRAEARHDVGRRHAGDATRLRLYRLVLADFHDDLARARRQFKNRPVDPADRRAEDFRDRVALLGARFGALSGFDL